MSETQKIKELKSIIMEMEKQIESLQMKLQNARCCARCTECSMRGCHNKSHW